MGLVHKMQKFLNYFFVASAVILSVVLFFLFLRVNKIEGFLATIKSETLIQEVDICGEDCKREVNDIVSKAIATVSGTTTTKTIISQVASAPKEKQTTYISLAGPITTTSMVWVDAAGTDTYIDLVNDYGKNTWVSWEANLKIADGNGQVFARLYDATHNIAVNGSEVSVTSGTSTQVISGQLSLWAGRNLYRVQLKSLNSFVATFASGRIKINY